MTSFRFGILVLFAGLIAFNGLVWVSSVISFSSLNPSAIGLLVLAWVLGLRHGLDADHILAIDNVTRSFLQQKQRPLTIGLYFSLGHCTIVVIATLIVMAVSGVVEDRFEGYSAASSIIGPAIAASFLILMTLINAYSCWLIIQQIRTLHTHPNPPENPNSTPSTLFQRLFGSFLDRIQKPWHMYIVGCLFGLGFDTATEVILLSVAALQSSSSVWILIYFALLFTAGMTLVDSIDGIVMLGVYDWAMNAPHRRIYFNLLVTSVSFLFALFIALLQILSIVHEQTETQGAFWVFIEKAGERFEWIGLGLLVCFLLGWLFTLSLKKMHKVV